MGRGDFYAEAHAPELMEAVTVNTPANASADLMVTIPSFGADMPPFGPVIWSPRGTQMPPAGTLCIVAKVGANVWVLEWLGTWAGGGSGARGSDWFTYSGLGTPTGLTGMANGDFCVRQSDGEIFEYVSGAWTDQGFVIKGVPGASGANGATWFTGSGVPSVGTGVNGDFYLRNTTGDVYQKSGGVWGSPIENLTGPTGATGPNPSYGNAAGEPAGSDKLLYVRTDDGDGGASTALWQYESGAYTRVGVPAKHASQHASGGSDPVTPATIGAVPASNRPTAVLTSNLGAINTQTTLQDITGLPLAISASATEIWLVKYWLIVSAANATMDLKIGFTVPASCTMQGGAVSGSAIQANGWTNAPVANSPLAIATQATTLALGTAALTNGILLSYLVFGGGSAGNVQIRYAQNTSDAGSLQVLKGSSFEATKLAA